MRQLSSYSRRGPSYGDTGWRKMEPSWAVFRLTIEEISESPRWLYGFHSHTIEDLNNSSVGGVNCRFLRPNPELNLSGNICKIQFEQFSIYLQYPRLYIASLDLLNIKQRIQRVRICIFLRKVFLRLKWSWAICSEGCCFTYLNLLRQIVAFVLVAYGSCSRDSANRRYVRDRRYRRNDCFLNKINELTRSLSIVAAWMQVII